VLDLRRAFGLSRVELTSCTLTSVQLRHKHFKQAAHIFLSFHQGHHHHHHFSGNKMMMMTTTTTMMMKK